MKKITLAFIILFHSSFCFAADLRSFLKTCAFGTLAGAAAGVVSLAFEDKPGDSWNNVAKGASLGLYAGIIYGVYKMNQTDEPAPTYSVAPRFSKKGDFEGVEMTGTVFEF